MELQQSYNEAIQFAKKHYENFPVLSLFLPRKIYKHVAVIYQFARQADDIADNPDEKIADRINKLQDYRDTFTSVINSKEPQSGFWAALANTINSFNLTHEYFYSLLDAFQQDLLQHEYETFDQLLSYCEKSANPVGRLILELLNLRSEERFLQSDKICSALQITNFLQDAKEDLSNGRNYFPHELMNKFGVSRADLTSFNMTAGVKDLVKYEIVVLRQMFFQGKSLLNVLPYRMKIQISATINGGMEILDKIEKYGYDVFSRRPVLTKSDFIKIFIKTLLTAE